MPCQAAAAAAAAAAVLVLLFRRPQQGSGSFARGGEGGGGGIDCPVTAFAQIHWAEQPCCSSWRPGGAQYSSTLANALELATTLECAQHAVQRGGLQNACSRELTIMIQRHSCNSVMKCTVGMHH
jgi:hypothetical protein